MHWSFKSLIIGVSLAHAMASFAGAGSSQNQVSEPIFKTIAPSCDDAGTNGRAISCLGSQLMLYTSAFQIMRYGMSAVTHGEVPDFVDKVSLFIAFALKITKKI